MEFKYLIVAVLAYAIGNLATSYLVSKRTANIDIRQHGSGNAGATNVLRVLGAKPAAVTFAGDALKGALAVMLGRYIAGTNGALIAGVFVVIGHNWPLVLRFKGGKGVASTIGVMLAIDPLAVLILGVFGLTILALTKYVSLASIMGMAAFPIVMILLKRPWEYIVFSLILAAMSIFKHRTNIVRLVKGTESKIGQKAKAE